MNISYYKCNNYSDEHECCTYPEKEKGYYNPIRCPLILYDMNIYKTNDFPCKNGIIEVDWVKRLIYMKILRSKFKPHGKR